jgi:branched-chain amino acid aminotransferase
MHKWMLHNGEIAATSAKLVSPGQVGLMNGWGVFSTIRVADGVLFAFERHLARMRKDARLMHVPFPEDGAALHRDLLRLAEANHARNATLRVCVVRNRGGLFEGDGIVSDFDVIAFTTDVHPWPDGVHLGIQPNARFAAGEFAGAKILSWSQNLVWLERARRRGLDEVILLDEHGRVSECTSANVFIATPEGVFTPPLSCGCLPGVTRELLLKEARPDGLPVVEREMVVADLYAADAVFITSTTRQLLPVKTLEGRELKQSSEYRRRMERSFSQYMDQYIAMATMRAQVVAHGVQA